MLRRRPAATFIIPFIDVMCCGFGVMVLLFLVIKHNPATMATSRDTTPDLSGEVKLLEEEVLEGTQGLAVLRNTIAEIDEQAVIAEGLARRIMEQIREKEGGDEVLAAEAADQEIESLQTRIQQLDDEKQGLKKDAEKTGEATRSFEGEGTRQYLTGLKLGGQHILVLLDTSASMLDKTIVNIVRRRNMSDEHKRSAEKWQQAVKTVDWLSAKFPPGSQYQIYTFNTETHSLLENTRGQWLNVSDRDQLNQAIKQLDALLPAGGTNLEQLFAEVGRLRPLPDNIYLITDGLPTQGARSSRATTISGRDRLSLFAEAIEKLPANIPVNIILSPMEGDPLAASAYWKLAIATNGSMMSPSEDWP